MPGHAIGEQAIVVGAGMAGLTAAAALAPHFARVTIIERDRLPEGPSARVGVPQGRHVHALQIGGLDALERLFPGFVEALSAAGAAPVRVGLDARVEQPGYDPFPRRDLGWITYSLSRPLLEHVTRGFVAGLEGVEIRRNCSVRAIAGEGGKATGVQVGTGEVLSADLVVDASGRGALTLDFLAASGLDAPVESAIPVDIRYTCATVSLAPEGRDWLMLQTRPDPKQSGRRAIMLPIEGGRWIVGLGGVDGDAAPADQQGFLDYARSLRTSTAYYALRDATFHGEIVRFAFPKSYRRHFERGRHTPRGLLPIGDAICRMNPSFGQGMSVAAKEAVLLGEVLKDCSGAADPLGDAQAAFFRRLNAVLGDAWAVAEQDYGYPHLAALRPADFAGRMRLQAAVTRIAAADPAMHRLMAEVGGMIRPSSAYQEPEIAARITAELAG